MHGIRKRAAIAWKRCVTDPGRPNAERPRPAGPDTSGETNRSQYPGPQQASHHAAHHYHG
jgi:hypothetical protein